MTYAIVSDVAAELGRPISEVSPEEQEQWKRWIARVEGRIEARISDLAVRAQDPAYLALLNATIVEIVVRRINNPQGMKSERIDDYYYDRGNQSSDLWPTDDEWRELGWFASSEAFSTRPSFEPDCIPLDTTWV